MLTITRPDILPSLAVTFLYLTGGFVILCYLAPLATEGAGLPVTVLPGMLLAFGVGAVAGNYASGQLADRLGPTRVVVLALLLSSTICVALTLILQLLPPNCGTAADRHHGPVGVRRLDVPARPGEPHRRPCARTRQSDAAAQRLGHVFRHRLRDRSSAGRRCTTAPPSELGIIAAGFPLAALVIVFANSRRRRVSQPAE